MSYVLVRSRNTTRSTVSRYYRLGAPEIPIQGLFQVLVSKVFTWVVRIDVIHARVSCQAVLRGVTGTSVLSPSYIRWWHTRRRTPQFVLEKQGENAPPAPFLADAQANRECCFVEVAPYRSFHIPSKPTLRPHSTDIHAASPGPPPQHAPGRRCYPIPPPWCWSPVFRIGILGSVLSPSRGPRNTTPVSDCPSLMMSRLVLTSCSLCLTRPNLVVVDNPSPRAVVGGLADDR